MQRGPGPPVGLGGLPPQPLPGAPPSLHDPPGRATPATEPDAAQLAAEPATTCLNCGAVLPGRFCPDCGQRDQPLRQPAHRFVTESVSEYFGVDGRLWRSLGLLLFRPGALTVAYLDGRRTRYLRPLRLYLTATVLFFFLVSLQDPFAVETETVAMTPVALDSLQRAETLSERLEERERAAEARQAAALTAAVSLRQLAVGDSLQTTLDSLGAQADSLDRLGDRLASLPDDSLVAPASLPGYAVVALRDTGSVEVMGSATQIVGGGFLEDIPEWAKGGLARRYEAAESPAERRLLDAQVQQAMLGQIPTALFLVLPVFALLLKGLYLFGAGRRPRHRPRPPAGAEGWRGGAAHVRLAAWRLGRWRQRRRVRRRRLKVQRSRERRVRGAWPRLRRRVAAHPRLRPWRVRRLRLLRRALRGRGSPYYAEHLVFALHVHAFTFLVFVPLLFLGAPATTTTTLAFALSVALCVAIPLYFLVAQHRVYRQGWGVTLVKASALGVVYFVVLALGTLVAAGLALRLA